VRDGIWIGRIDLDAISEHRIRQRFCWHARLRIADSSTSEMARVMLCAHGDARSSTLQAAQLLPAHMAQPSTVQVDMRPLNRRWGLRGERLREGDNALNGLFLRESRPQVKLEGTLHGATGTLSGLLRIELSNPMLTALPACAWPDD